MAAGFSAINRKGNEAESGYRRMQLALAAQGAYLNAKNVLRIVKKYDLLSEIRRRRWVNMGQQLHRYENLLDREFNSDKPNQKWVTDIR